jgi:hypothetical protein
MSGESGAVVGRRGRAEIERLAGLYRTSGMGPRTISLLEYYIGSNAQMLAWRSVALTRAVQEVGDGSLHSPQPSAASSCDGLTMGTFGLFFDVSITRASLKSRLRKKSQALCSAHHRWNASSS